MSPVKLMRARLQLPEGQVSAEVMTWWSVDPDGLADLLQFRVTEAPNEIPEGEYLVSFGGLTRKTAKRGGFWELTLIGAD